jgi:hypothetical protein
MYNILQKEQIHGNFRSSIHRFFSASEENTLDWPSFSIKWPMTDVSPDLESVESGISRVQRCLTSGFISFISFLAGKSMN